MPNQNEKAPPQQPKEHHHTQFIHNAARQFGSAMMFGAGATLGSDLVNDTIGKFKEHEKKD